MKSEEIIIENTSYVCPESNVTVICWCAVAGACTFVSFLCLGEGLDDAELLLWALQCVVDFPAALSALVDDEFGTFETGIVVPRCGAVRCGVV